MGGTLGPPPLLYKKAKWVKLSEFLNAVVPDGIFVVGKKNDKGFRHSVAKSQADALKVIRRFAAGTDDIYFALASYKQGFHPRPKDGKKVLRVRDNVSDLQALWFDIDFKGGLSDPTAVVAALRGFSNGTGIPAPSILVHSGNGVHVYWAFTESVPLARWQPMADRLKELALEHRLPTDSVCTADPCRVLRPPGTQNFKDKANPKPVYFLYDGGKRYDPAALEVTLGVGVPAQRGTVGAKPSGLGSVPEYAKAFGHVDEEFSGGGSGTFEPVQSLFSNIIEQCGVAKSWVDDAGASCSEPEWTAALQLLKHCTDGELWVHEISKGHIDYDPGATNTKYEQRLSNDAGPTLCRTFAGYRPKICEECPHNGKIKTPLVTGVEQDIAVVLGTALTSWRVNPDGRGMDRKMLNPDTMLYEWMPTLRRVFDNISISRSEVSNFYDIHFSAKLRNAIDLEIILPTGHLGNDTKLKEAMASFGAPLRGKELNPFKDFMGTWLEKLQDERAINSVTEQLGWYRTGEEKAIKGFSDGSTTYLSDGTDKLGVRCPKEFLAIGRMYKPAGKKEPWLRVAKFLADQDHAAFTATLASAFAAPLLTFTGVSGGILSIVSAESGVGKSSALRCAQAVWGSPTHGMSAVDDTRLSVARKLGFLNNLPAYWDELRGPKNMEEFCTLAFQVSQGKEKTRLDSTATMRDVNTWETMVIAASNESIFEYMGGYAVGSDAGIARTFEIMVEAPQTDRSRSEIAIMFETLNQNYGHAGAVYSKYLATNHERVKEQVTKTFMALASHANMKASERFWFAIVAALVVGAKLARDAGLVDINVKSLVAYLLQNISQLRIRSRATMIGTTPAELIAAYMAQHQDKALIVEELRSGAGGTYTPVVISLPRADRVVFQLARKDGIVRVAKGDFTRWMLKSQGIPFSAVAKKFKADLQTVVVKTSLGIGTKYQVPRQLCLDIKIDMGVK